MEYDVKRLLEELTGRAAEMAESAKDAALGAGKVVNEKKDEALLRLDLVRLKNDCESIFNEIGRSFYLMNSGRWPKDGETAEHRIESLLSQVDEKQMRIVDIQRRLADLSGKTVCPGCGRLCDTEDAFCTGCGAALKKEELAADGEGSN